MCRANRLTTLDEEILSLKEELDSLLYDESITSQRALELSQKLDLLIVQYYNL